MDKHDLIKIAEDFIMSSEDNYISGEIAISESLIGMKIFDAPIFAFASANDESFMQLNEPSVIGEHFMPPGQWLPQCKTVISFFLPYSKSVREGNKNKGSWPSDEWLHGRIEGQALINKLSVYLKSELEKRGYDSIIPNLDDRFWSNTGSKPDKPKFTSNWSERHVAFVCGHGTFGLSMGLITQRGMAGRFGSIVTKLQLPPSKRLYEKIDEYCSMCGSCVKNCPVNAITIEGGKDHSLCSRFLDATKKKYKPRYGCGKCQVGVPCEFEIPEK